MQESVAPIKKKIWRDKSRIYVENIQIMRLFRILDLDSIGIEKMMKDVMDGKIEEIVCTHKDRLCRFGFELIEMIFQKFGVSFGCSECK